MNMTDIAKMRLVSQQLVETPFTTVKNLVSWMGAMQAQDYAMVKWALGVRLPGSTDQGIEAAINTGDIIRTHVLRPTWHVVSAADVRWMLALTAPRIKASLRSRHKALELSEPVVLKSHAVIEHALRDGVHLTREEMIAELENAHILTGANRASHLLLRAELDGIVCSGVTQGGKYTYALLEERVPTTHPLSKEEALATLARTYFTSHGPAMIQDFAWWSGLPVSDAKRAVDMIASDVLSETIDAHTYWWSRSLSMPAFKQDIVSLLPAFDEFLISYKDRSASLPFQHHTRTVSNNGIFRPVIAVNGQVIGIWKRTTKRDIVVVETALFTQPDTAIMGFLEHAALQFGQFLEKQAEIHHQF